MFSMITYTTELNMASIERLIKVLDAEQRGSLSGPLTKTLNEWAELYLKFLYTRFTRYSMGGGDWAPKSSRRAKRVGHNTILVDTGTLRNMLNPRYKGEGQIRKRVKNTIEVGYGPGIHPKSDLTVDSLADLHQTGFTTKQGGRVPGRRIIVPPDSSVTNQFQQILRKNLLAHMKKIGVVR